MKKNLKKIISVILTAIICSIMFTIASSAAETINGNTWYGDQVAVDVTAGTEGYTFMSLFRPYVHGYEFGGHFMGDGEGPQTFVVIDTEKYAGTTWTPSGVYNPMGSNYDVTYCCDVETMIVDGTYYKRLNLEDSEYYNEAQAAKIRAIVTNSYPYVSLEAMKADLAANGYAYAEELTRNEIIAAVQCAIWASANGMTAEDLRYAKSYRVSDNLQWGYPMYDTSAESGLDVAGKRVFKTYPEVGTRIDSLVDYLLAQTATFADKAQVVITKLEMSGEPIALNDDMFTVKLILELNNSGSGYEDNINICLTVGGNEIIIPVELNKERYELEVTAHRNDTIKAVVSGTQVLPKGVYFYAPKPADVSGAFDEKGEDIPDGIATSREVSQNLVGVAMGATPVFAEAELNLTMLPPPAPEKVNVYGYKIWDDENNVDGKRPSAITVNLHANGTIIASKVVTEYDGWSWSFNDLDKYSNGMEISYTVSEDMVPEYTTNVVGYNIINTYVPAKTHVIVQKVWDDNNNQDGLRPDHITVALQTNGATVDTATLSESNGWSHIFSNLNKYEYGMEISYSISEEFVYGYTSSITKSMYSGYIITNTHTPETVSVNGTKTWIDDNNINNTRPENITVNLYADGTYLTSKVVSEFNGWAYSFNNLPKYKNGHEIVYTISEDAVFGYETEIIGYDIFNSFIPEIIEDEEVPLTPPPVEYTEEEIEKMIEELLEEIIDEEVPLVDNPSTSDDAEETSFSAVSLIATAFVVLSVYVAVNYKKLFASKK